MAFSLMNGLSQAGASIAQTAGAEGLEMQKSDLQSQRDQLAAATAHQYKGEEAVQSEQLAEQGTGVTAGYAATAASKLADVNAAAASKLADFQTGLAKLQGSNQLAVAKVGAGAEIGAANISAAASQANVKAQLAQGDVQVGPDGTFMSIDKTTGKEKPITDDAGNPVKGVVPGQAALIRDMVQSTNEQMRAVTNRYDNDLRGPQKNLEDAMKAAATAQVDPAKDPGVIEAKAAVDAIKKEYQPALDNLNKNMSAAAAAMLGSTSVGAGAPGNAPQTPPKAPGGPQRPPLASFNQPQPTP